MGGCLGGRLAFGFLLRAARLGTGLRPKALLNGIPAFVTELLERPFGVQVQISRIGPHIARDEPWRIKRTWVGILDRRDVRGLDLQLALHIQQRFTHRGPLATHDVPKAQVKIVKALRLCRCRISRLLAPDHLSCLIGVTSFTSPGQRVRIAPELSTKP